MRILALSDLHFGKNKPGWVPAEERITAAIIAAEKFEPDVLYFGGDLAESPEDFKRGMEWLDGIPFEKRVFVCGNNDLELLSGSRMTAHGASLADKVDRYGFHVLDLGPYIYNDEYAFVGNIGWHDGSFWRPPEVSDPKWPSTIEDVMVKDRAYWEKTTAGFSRRGVPEEFHLTSEQFHLMCMEDLENAVLEVGDRKIVLCTHYVPSRDFVAGDSPKFEFLNHFMGFNGRAQAVYSNPNVVLGLCGHTHRDHMAMVGTTVVLNVSGPSQPTIIDR